MSTPLALSHVMGSSEVSPSSATIEALSASDSLSFRLMPPDF